MTKHVALYARISVTMEESVSLSRQLDAGRRYAEARGWTVVGEFKDDGISASANRPEDRKAWKAVLDHPGPLDAVVIWKVDRLARRVIDFLNANAALQHRGAGIVAVEDPVDMTTPQGRAFATLLAVFGELEAASISARVAAARTHLLKAGRVVGGSIPFGWQSVRNPNGAGYVLAQDPRRVGYVREMVRRVLAGATLYSVKCWLDSEGVPAPTWAVPFAIQPWAYSTVERLLRNPILAGQIAWNPGNQTKVRGDDVLRDETGLPVVNESLAILTSDERRKLLALLDDRDSAQAKPRASKGTTSALLSRVARCGNCDVIMTRGTTAGRPMLTCPRCHQTITRNQLDPHIVRRLLDERGDLVTYKTTDITVDNATELADIEEALKDAGVRITRDGADFAVERGKIEVLQELRAKARAVQPVGRNWRISERTVRMLWDAAEDDLQRREVLAGQIESLRIMRGKTGRYLDPMRVVIEWRRDPFDEAEDQADNAERWEAYWPTTTTDATK